MYMYIGLTSLVRFLIVVWRHWYGVYWFDAIVTSAHVYWFDVTVSVYIGLTSLFRYTVYCIDVTYTGERCVSHSAGRTSLSYKFTVLSTHIVLPQYTCTVRFTAAGSLPSTDTTLPDLDFTWTSPGLPVKSWLNLLKACVKCWSNYTYREMNLLKRGCMTWKN